MNHEEPPGVDETRLLRAYEPVVRLTRGEYFLPVSVERYVAQAALWVDDEESDPRLVAEPGVFDLSTLARAGGASQGLGLSLSTVRTGLTDPGRATIPVKDRPRRLTGASRLAAVGLLGRVVDSLARLSLLFRGRVPGGSAARAFLTQQAHLEPDRPTYCGRVVRDGPWLVCQYWYFYAFNNWRSAFGGVNEHEGDWEQVTVYLDGSGETDDHDLPPPRWVVFSAHDETGDDLRRRWDDPDLELVDGRHPVVHAGAGSHSGAYLAGDYLITVEPPSLGGVVGAVRWLARVFTPWSSTAQRGVGIPYVDYARGDGVSIGPGQQHAWTCVPIDDTTAWVRDYRGLWGLDTGDRLGGERGPAGPRYQRDGTVRQSWGDPVGWAGLAKVAPNPRVEQALLASRSEALEESLADLESQLADGRQALAEQAAGLTPGSPEVRALEGEEERLSGLRMEQVRLQDERAHLAETVVAHPDPRAHLRHRRTPLAQQRGARARALSWWAVLSTPLILLAIAAVLFPPAEVSAVSTALAWLVLLMSIEGLVRGQFLQVFLRFLVIVAIGIALYFLWVDARVVLGALFAAAAAVVLVLNVREALRR